MSIRESIETQYVLFDQMRGEIHAELDHAGVGDVLAAQGTVLDTRPFEPMIPLWMQQILDRNLPPEELPGNFQYHVDKLWLPYRGRTRISRLAVGLSREYSSHRADMYQDLDPLARLVAIGYEVGVVTDVYKDGNPAPVGTSQNMLLASEALVGGVQEQTVLELNLSQIALIEGAVSRLKEAKRSGALRDLSKSLTKIDPAGD